MGDRGGRKDKDKSKQQHDKRQQLETQQRKDKAAPKAKPKVG